MSAAATVPGRVHRRRWPGLLVMPGIPLLILGLIVFAALAAPLLTPHDPVRSDLGSRMLPPAWIEGGGLDHLLGTDRFGRDVFSRLIYGARVSLSVAALSIAVALVIGLSVGVIAGYAGGWFDSLAMRVVDMVLSVPLILIALALAVAIGPSFGNIVLVIGLLLWPGVARLVRGEILLLKRQDFVRYAKAIGVPSWLIILRHVIPNVMPTLLVAATLEVGAIVLLEASLSFLGAGVPPPAPSWGVMVSDGSALIATGWWIALFPGLSIMICVLVLNTLGDWLRDHFDPRLRGL